jgi:hypothetical protein
MPTNTWSSLGNRVTGEVLDYADVNDIQNNDYFNYVALSAEHNMATTATGAGGQGAHKLWRSDAGNSTADANDSIFLNFEATLSTVGTYVTIDTRYDYTDRYILVNVNYIFDRDNMRPGGSEDDNLCAGILNIGGDVVSNELPAAAAAGFVNGIFYSRAGVALSTSTATPPSLALYGNVSALNEHMYITVNTAGDLILGDSSTNNFSTSAFVYGFIQAGPKQNDR